MAQGNQNQTNDQLEKLTQKIRDMGSSISKMNIAVRGITDTLKNLADLSARTTYMMALLGGLPRQGLSPLAMFLGDSAKGNKGSGKGGLVSGSGDKDWDAFYKKIEKERSQRLQNNEVRSTVERAQLRGYLKQSEVDSVIGKVVEELNNGTRENILTLYEELKNSKFKGATNLRQQAAEAAAPNALIGGDSSQEVSDLHKSVIASHQAEENSRKSGRDPKELMEEFFKKISGSEEDVAKLLEDIKSGSNNQKKSAYHELMVILGKAKPPQNEEELDLGRKTARSKWKEFREDNEVLPANIYARGLEEKQKGSGGGALGFLGMPLLGAAMDPSGVTGGLLAGLGVGFLLYKGIQKIIKKWKSAKGEEDVGKVLSGGRSGSGGKLGGKGWGKALKGTLKGGWDPVEGGPAETSGKEGDIDFTDPDLTDHMDDYSIGGMSDDEVGDALLTLDEKVEKRKKARTAGADPDAFDQLVGNQEGDAPPDLPGNPDDIFKGGPQIEGDDVLEALGKKAKSPEKEKADEPPEALDPDDPDAFDRLVGNPAAKKKKKAEEESTDATEDSTEATESLTEVLKDEASAKDTSEKKGEKSDWITGALAGAKRGALFGGTAIGNILNAGAPDMLATLKGSFQLLVAEIASGMIPALVKLSGWIQGVAKWYGSLSEKTKDLIGSIVVWTTVGLAAVSVVNKLVGVFSGLVSVGIKAVMGIKALAASAMSGSTSAKVGIAGLVSAFGVGVMALMNKIHKNATHGGLDKSLQNSGYLSDVQKSGFDSGEVSKLERIAGVKSGESLTDEQYKRLQKYAGSQGDKALDKLKEANRLQGELPKTMFGMNFLKMGEYKDKRDRRNKLIEEAGVLGRDSKTFNVYDQWRKKKISNNIAIGADRLEGTSLKDFADTIKQIKSKGKSGDVDNANMILHSISSATKATPQYSSVEDLYKQIQVSALSKDPLEVELLKKQFKAQEKMLEHLANQIKDGKIRNEMLKRIRGAKEAFK